MAGWTKLTGMPELMGNIDRLQRSFSDERLVAPAREMAETAAQEWRARVPVLDGNYRRSIQSAARPGRKGATGVAFISRVSGVPENQQPYMYAARLEFGRYGTAAQPSARPAADAAGGKVRTKVSKTIWRMANER